MARKKLTEEEKRIRKKWKEMFGPSNICTLEPLADAIRNYPRTTKDSGNSSPGDTTDSG